MPVLRGTEGVLIFVWQLAPLHLCVNVPATPTPDHVQKVMKRTRRTKPLGLQMFLHLIYTLLYNDKMFFIQLVSCDFDNLFQIPMEKILACNGRIHMEKGTTTFMRVMSKCINITNS